MTDSRKPTMPDDRRLARLALSVLEDAYAAAEDQARPQTAATRLALGTLLRLGIAELHQAERFVQGMTDERDAVGTAVGYMRRTNMMQLIYTWQAEIRRRDRAAADARG